MFFIVNTCLSSNTEHLLAAKSVVGIFINFVILNILAANEQRSPTIPPPRDITQNFVKTFLFRRYLITKFTFLKFLFASLEINFNLNFLVALIFLKIFSQYEFFVFYCHKQLKIFQILSFLYLVFRLFHL